MFAKIALAALAVAVSTPVFADAAADRVWTELRAAGASNYIPFTGAVDFDGIGLTSTEVGVLVNSLSDRQIGNLDRTCRSVVIGGGSANAVAFCQTYRAQVDDREANDRNDLID